MFDAAHHRVLMFFAHPDDETLAAGATINKLIRLGVDVWVAIPGTGAYARDAAKPADQERLRADCLTALGRLGVAQDHTLFGDFPDNAMDSRPLIDLIKWAEDALNKSRCNVVFTHHQRCTNMDHRYCFEAATVATRPGVSSHVPLIAGEVPSSTGHLRPAEFEPNLYVEVDERALAAKIAAMQAYSGEIREFPHPRSPEFLKALAQVRGAEAGFNLAEAFVIMRTFV